MISQILITGGAGFIGYHLANYFAIKGYDICLVDNCSRGKIDADLEKLLEQDNVALIEVDLLDRDHVLELGVEYSAIFHLGAIIGVQNVMDRPFNVLVENTRMLENVIALAHRQSHLSRFLFASTSEVYAGTFKHFGLEIPTPEGVNLAITALDQPRTSYMLSKIMGEAMLQQAGLPFTIFRPHNIYGPRMGMAHVIPEQLKKAFEAETGDRLDVYSANHTRAFCYIDDAVEMLFRMMESPFCLGQTLNLGAEAPELTMREVAQACIDVTGKELGINDLPPAAGSPERRAPDMSRSNRLLNYVSVVTLVDGIVRTWDWYREHEFERRMPSVK